MSEHPIAGAIKRLAEAHQLQHKNGSVNCSAFGRYSNLPATTIMRLLKADDTWTPRVNTVRRISKAFGVTEGQLLGYDEMRGGSPAQLPAADLREHADQALSEFEQLFILRLRTLRFLDQVEVMRFLEFKNQDGNPGE